MIKKLWMGGYGLAKTFWVFWFIPTILLIIFVSSPLYLKVLAKLVGVNINLGLLFANGIPIVIAAYHLVMSVINWRTSSKYKGMILWPILTKGYVIIFIGITVYSLYFSFMN